MSKIYSFKLVYAICSPLNAMGAKSEEHFSVGANDENEALQKVNNAVATFKAEAERVLQKGWSIDWGEPRLI